jgi:hypothetical protein
MLFFWVLSFQSAAPYTPTPDSSVYRGMWNPQGTLIAFDTTDSIWIYTSELQFVQQLSTRLPGAAASQSAWVGRMTWSPDGTKLGATVVFEGTLNNIPAIHRYALIWNTSNWVRTVVTDYIETSIPLGFKSDNSVLVGAVETNGIGSHDLKYFNSMTGANTGSLANYSQGGIRDLIWSPIDNTKLVVARAKTIEIWSTNEGLLGTIPNFSGDPGIALSPTNPYVAFINNDWDVEVWDIHAIQQVWVINEPDYLTSFDWVGSDVITESLSQDFKRWNVTSGESVFIVNNPNLRSWNPTGSVYLATDTTGIFIYDSITHELLSSLLLNSSS